QTGVYDISLEVSDSGLPPQDAGYIADPDETPEPNVVVRDVRIVVRATDTAPQLLAVEASAGGAAVTDGELTTVSASEGQALVIDVLARDVDFDAIDWRVEGMPSGMTLEPVAGSDGQSQLRLRWTPGTFAAQSGNNGGNNGSYTLVLRATDGALSTTHTIQVQVANVNQTPQLLPMPLQLVQEGQTLGFTLTAVDADNDALELALVYDASTPKNCLFDAKTGYFEWTSDASVVVNAQGDTRIYTFTFTATDGVAVTQ